MYKINKEISTQILTIGMQYKNHRGGIGGVIETYSKYFEEFNFLCSFYKYDTSLKGKVEMSVNFFGAILKLLWKLTFNKSFKIVHLHGAAKGSLFRKYVLFKITKSVFNRTVIFHCHASEMKQFYLEGSIFTKKVCENFFNNVDLIICLSRSWEEFFSSNFRPKAIEVLENIVQNPNVAGLKKKKVDYPIEFLFLGYLGDRKGIFDLITVIDENKDLLRGKFKLIVGGNGDAEKLNNILKDKQLFDLVEYKGWISGELKSRLLLNSDVYILPSYNEGLPLSILEAMSYGNAIISTNVGGIAEVVKPSINGFIIEPGNYLQINETIISFLNYPSLAAEFGINSFEMVTPYYAENVIPKLENMYKSLLNKRNEKN
tara:strand:+ start:20798 stop:21916 length:1119 start_codon:yes stop_codon:yes gene_type:complete